MLINYAVTAKLICFFVFAYADCWFSHEAAQISKGSDQIKENKSMDPGPLGPKEIDGLLVPPSKAYTLLTDQLITG